MSAFAWTIERVQQKRAMHLHLMERMREHGGSRSCDYRLHEQDVALCDLALANMTAAELVIRKDKEDDLGVLWLGPEMIGQIVRVIPTGHKVPTP